MLHRAIFALFVCAFVVIASFGQPAPEDKDKPTGPGQTKNGFVLPNGWTLTPAGKHVELTDLAVLYLALVAFLGEYCRILIRVRDVYYTGNVAMALPRTPLKDS